MRQIDNIQTARGNVRRHQHSDFIGLEGSQRTFTGGLTLVPVNRHRADALFIELRGQTVGSVLGAGKDEHLRPIAALDQIDQ